MGHSLSFISHVGVYIGHGFLRSPSLSSSSSYSWTMIGGRFPPRRGRKSLNSNATSSSSSSSCWSTITTRRLSSTQVLLVLVLIPALLLTVVSVHLLDDPPNVNPPIQPTTHSPHSSSSSSSSCVSEPVVISNHTIRLYERPCQPITVAYAISLIKVRTYVRINRFGLERSMDAATLS